MIEHAFPSSPRYGAPRGMTLRDWFAGQALAGALAQGSLSVTEGTARTVADSCYKLADAMLAARAKEPTP